MSIAIIFEKFHPSRIEDLRKALEEWVVEDHTYTKCFRDLRYCISIQVFNDMEDELPRVMEILDVEDERIPQILTIIGRDSFSIHVEKHGDVYEVYTGFEELLSFPGIDFVSQLLEVYGEGYVLEPWYEGTARVRIPISEITAESFDNVFSLLLKALTLYRVIIESQKSIAVNIALSFLKKS